MLAWVVGRRAQGPLAYKGFPFQVPQLDLGFGPTYLARTMHAKNVNIKPPEKKRIGTCNPAAL